MYKLADNLLVKSHTDGGYVILDFHLIVNHPMEYNDFDINSVDMRPMITTSQTYICRVRVNTVKCYNCGSDALIPAQDTTQSICCHTKYRFCRNCINSNTSCYFCTMSIQPTQHKAVPTKLIKKIETCSYDSNSTVDFMNMLYYADTPPPNRDWD